MRDRRLIAIVGAGVIAVVAILVVVLVGAQSAPEFADLAGSGLTGFVAYARNEGEPATSLRIVDLSTARSVEVRISEGSEALGWDEDGNLMVVQWGPSARVSVRPSRMPTSSPKYTADSDDTRFWR